MYTLINSLSANHTHMEKLYWHFPDFLYIKITVATLVVSKEDGWGSTLVVATKAGKPRFLENVFRFFKKFFRFSVQIRPDTKFRPRKNILYTIPSVTPFSINYNKTHK